MTVDELVVDAVALNEAALDRTAEPIEGAPMIDWRDLVIEDLADSECLLRARVQDLECERDSYRALAQAGVQALHHLTRERDRLRTRVAALRASVRTVDQAAA